MNIFQESILRREVKEGFKVLDLQSANWTLQRLNVLYVKIKEVEDVAAAEIERINSWLDKEVESYKESKLYLESLLTEYFKSQREVDSKFKLKTPYGSVSSKKTKTLSYDETIMKEYLKVNHPDLIEVVERFKKSDVNKLIKNGIDVETGEIIDFVEERENTSYIVKVEG